MTHELLITTLISTIDLVTFTLLNSGAVTVKHSPLNTKKLQLPLRYSKYIFKFDI